MADPACRAYLRPRSRPPWGTGEKLSFSEARSQQRMGTPLFLNNPTSMKSIGRSVASCDATGVSRIVSDAPSILAGNNTQAVSSDDALHDQLRPAIGLGYRRQCELQVFFRQGGGGAAKYLWATQFQFNFNYCEPVSSPRNRSTPGTPRSAVAALKFEVPGLASRVCLFRSCHSNFRISALLCFTLPMNVSHS